MSILVNLRKSAITRPFKIWSRIKNIISLRDIKDEVHFVLFRVLILYENWYNVSISLVLIWKKKRDALFVVHCLFQFVKNLKTSSDKTWLNWYYKRLLKNNVDKQILLRFGVQESPDNCDIISYHCFNFLAFWNSHYNILYYCGL